MDKEHSSIENALKLASIDPCVVKRLHATTFDVFINEVANGKYSVIQFSGHGSCDGVYFENKIGSASEIISADSLANALSLSQIPIMALILTCCYSEDHISELSKYAHYLITVDGPAPDVAAIEFSKAFFSQYFIDYSVERSFQMALMTSRDPDLRINIHRRGVISGSGRILIDTMIKHHKLVVDLTEACDDIPNDTHSREKFLETLCTSTRTILRSS